MLQLWKKQIGGSCFFLSEANTILFNPRELRICVPTEACPGTLIAALFIEAADWKSPGCPLTSGWIVTLWSGHTAKRFLAIIGNELLGHPTHRQVSDVRLSQKGLRALRDLHSPLGHRSVQCQKAGQLLTESRGRGGRSPGRGTEDTRPVSLEWSAVTKGDTCFKAHQNLH